MPDSPGRADSRVLDQPSASLDAGIGTPEDDDALAPAEAFQTLASEVRVAVLVRLLAAERNDESPLSFSALQRATDVESSAGFAYHLRQLSGHFVRREGEGYALTPPGRRTAKAIADGTFTSTAPADRGDRTRAS